MNSVRFFSGRLMMFTSYWYSSLYIVVEGYRDVGLSDDQVDALLNDDAKVSFASEVPEWHVHFQKAYLDSRVNELMIEAAEQVPWIQKLDSAFSGFFVALFEKAGTVTLVEVEERNPEDQNDTG